MKQEKFCPGWENCLKPTCKDCELKTKSLLQAEQTFMEMKQETDDKHNISCVTCPFCHNKFPLIFDIFIKYLGGNTRNE